MAMEDREQRLTIPRLPLLMAVLGTGMICGGAAVVTVHYLQRAPDLPPALAGVAATTAMFLVGAALIASGKPRPASTLAAFWLGATILRLLGLMALGIPIYFAVPSGLAPFALGAGGAYLACLVAETASVARQALKSMDTSL